MIKSGYGGESILGTRAARALAGFLELTEELMARSRELNLIELFDSIIERSGYRDYIMGAVDGEERWENILELRGVAEQYRDLKPGEGSAAFLEGVTLVSDVDGYNKSVDAVTLITLHQAKGLEFPVVFMVGMEEGILPHIRSFDDPAQMEEERRLCYVGVTRAKRKVYLVRAFRRTLMGSSMAGVPSRFLKDIPSHLLTTTDFWQGENGGVPAGIYSWDYSPVTRVDVVELRDGDHVRHDRFGEGVVVSCQRVKDDTEVVVAFSEAGVKRLSLNFARLEKVK